MEIKVVIDKDTIENNTDTSTSISELSIEGSSLSCAHDPIFTGFFKKIMPIFKENRNIDLKYTQSSAGEVITWVTIMSNSVTSSVFDIFKSIGIYMPKLVIGVCEASHTVYTSSKLCKDLNKYSDTQRAAILMYILTLAHFVKKAEELLITFNYDGLSGALKIDGKRDTLLQCMRTFDTEETWYLKDSNKDDYTAVQFHNSARVCTVDQYANVDGIRISVAKHKTGKHIGIATVKFGATLFTFVLSDRVIFTDFDLCNLEISPDSICALIASAYPGAVSVKKYDKLPLSNEMSFVEFDGEDVSEFSKSEKLPHWLQVWLTRILSKKVTVADFDELTYLNKAYGVTLPVGSGTTSLSYEDMKKIYETDEYAQELYKQLQPYYDTYKLGTELDANLKGFSNGALYSMAFIGESGTGKSTAARVIPARCGIPYISVNFSVNIEEADLFGSMVPNPKKSKPEDPEFVWADGIITKAVRNGYCVILEELNFAHPGVLGKLNSLLDENRQIDLSTGEIVKAHPNFRIIATCNIAYEGTNRFNKALINRFDDVTIFKDLSRSEAIEVIKSRTKYSNTSKISKVYDVYEALKKFATEQNVNAVVSMRQLLNIFTKGKYYSNAKDAVQRIMLNGAFIEDSEYQKVFEETVFTAFDLKFKI